MVAVYSTNLQIYNAKQFKESVSEIEGTRLYLTIGKATPWANDSAPQQANSSVTSFNEVWENMIGAKLITGFDISHAIVRHDWTANTVYDAYDHCTCSLMLFNANTEFYTVTPDWNVYKCIANNNGAMSTVMPTSISTTETTTEVDGYVWKYMYTISSSDRLKFITDNYIPVKTLTSSDNSLQWQVQESAIDGSIEAIKVVNGGSNYVDSSSVTINITGDGIGANAIANVDTTLGTIKNIIMTDRGRGYTYAEVTATSNTTGNGATFRAMISPTGGHGFDPVSELGGFYLVLNPRLYSTESGILDIDNEYRQIAIIKDPELYGDSQIASNTVVSQLMTMALSGVSNEYVEDEVVYQGANPETAAFTARVVSWDSANGIIKLSNYRGEPVTDILYGQNSAASKFINSITYPTLKPRSGQLLYIDNIPPIQRNQDQVEDFKIVLKF